METTRDWGQVEQVIKGVSLVVIEDNDLVLKHLLYILLSVEI